MIAVFAMLLNRPNGVLIFTKIRNWMRFKRTISSSSSLKMMKLGLLMLIQEILGTKNAHCCENIFVPSISCYILFNAK